ncbi:MAG: hypothetical protein V4535_06350 [Bacteroidota bacterium]
MYRNLKVVVLMAICFNYSFSQQSFLEPKDGKKVSVDASSVELLDSQEKFKYKEANSQKENKISLNQIKTAVLGNYHIETFTIDKKPEVCFVIAESNGKKLVGFNKTKNTSTTMSSGFSTIYYYYVLDNNNNLIDKMKFASDDYGGTTKERDDAEAIIRKHFSDCSGLIWRLNENDTKKMDLDNASKTAKKFAKKFDEGNAKMILLFSNPKFSSCSISEESPIKKDITETVTIANQDYAFGSTTIDVTGKNNKMSMKGTLSVKDGYFCCVTKYNSTKYKITSYKDGIITCLDSERDLEYTVSIVPENGRESGFAYDTKIIFIVDKKMGGSTSYYWCKKQ